MQCVWQRHAGNEVWGFQTESLKSGKVSTIQATEFADQYWRFVAIDC